MLLALSWVRILAQVLQNAKGRKKKRGRRKRRRRRRRKFEHRHREEGHGKMEAETGILHLWSQRTPRISSNHQKLEEVRKHSSLVLWREHGASILLLDF